MTFANDFCGVENEIDKNGGDLNKAISESLNQ